VCASITSLASNGVRLVHGDIPSSFLRLRKVGMAQVLKALYLYLSFILIETTDCTRGPCVCPARGKPCVLVFYKLCVDMAGLDTTFMRAGQCLCISTISSIILPVIELAEAKATPNACNTFVSVLALFSLHQTAEKEAAIKCTCKESALYY